MISTRRQKLIQLTRTVTDGTEVDVVNLRGEPALTIGQGFSSLFRVTCSIQTNYTGGTLTDGEYDDAISFDFSAARDGADIVTIAGETSPWARIVASDTEEVAGSYRIRVYTIDDDGDLTGIKFTVQDGRDNGGASAVSCVATITVERLSETGGTP
jgi:hypothetical protein